MLKIAKPILFNTEMIRAMLDGRKTATRRLIKPQHLIGFLPDKCKNGTPEEFLKEKKYMFKPYCNMTDVEMVNASYKPLYKLGDIMYVRETWSWYPCWDCGMYTEEGCCNKTSLRFYHPEKHKYGCYVYRASFEDNEMPFDRWYPSIHMPKEAARIFLRVTDIRVERLQDIKPEDAVKEGTRESSLLLVLDEFIGIWNSTIKKEELEQYGWEANPWVWVIQFERLECN